MLTEIGFPQRMLVHTPSCADRMVRVGVDFRLPASPAEALATAARPKSSTWPARRIDFVVDRDARRCVRARTPAPRRFPWRGERYLECNRARKVAPGAVKPKAEDTRSLRSV